MLSFTDMRGRQWFQFISRWSLLAGSVYLGLFLVFFVAAFPATQNSPLSEEYNDLMLAIRSVLVSRLTITLALTYWLMIGGFLIVLALVLVRRAPILSALIAACGIGQLLGVLGNIDQLNGISDIASRYVTATADQQSALLRSFLDLRLVYTSDFEASGFLWAIALLFMAWVAWSMSEFPRWMTGLLAFNGLIGLVYSGFMFVMGKYEPPVLSEILLMVVFFAIAIVFWGRASGREARSG